MDTETGEPLLIDGRIVTAERTFRAVEASGDVEVTFKFNSVSLIGQSAVVFQNLYWNDDLIYEHNDINNENQTVSFRVPAIGTTAKGADGNKIIPLDEKAVIIDVVDYENLSIGANYTLVGILMDKATGRPVLVNGETVTAQTTFQALETSGSVNVVFTFDTRELEGKTLVVFEYLYYQSTLIAEHTDINDEAQTVTIATKEPEKEPEPETDKPGGGAQTGQDGLPVIWLVIGASALVGEVGGIVLYIIKRRREM
jgi:hypothetical protein